MPPSRGKTVETPIRQSCDGCHNQKLRCTRSSANNTGACDRCLRKHAQCIYSFSLPKGRPSLYQLAESTRTRESASASVADVPLPESDKEQSKPDQELSKAAVLETPKSEVGDPMNIDSTGPDLDPDSDPVPNAPTAAHSEAPVKSIEDTIVTTTAGSHQRLDDLTGHDAELLWSDLDLSSFQEADMSDQWPLSDEWLLDFPELLDWMSAQSDLIRDGSSSPGAQLLTPIDSDLPLHGPEVTRSSDSGSLLSWQPHLLIAMLSQLSIRLSKLHRVANNLAAVSKQAPYQSGSESNGSSSSSSSGDQQRSLIDDTAFESVAAWVAAHGSANNGIPLSHLSPSPPAAPLTDQLTVTGTLLFQIFSCSSQILEVLHHLQLPGTSLSKHGSSSNPPPPHPTTPFAAPHVNDPNSEHVIRHLLFACHTVLMNIYTMILAILEDDIHLRRRKGDLTTAVGEICIVVIVQLCSYLTDRQHQAIRTYLANQYYSLSTPPQTSLSLSLPVSLSRWLEYSSSDGEAQAFPHDYTIGSEIGDLKTEVQHRLVRLQQVLGC